MPDVGPVNIAPSNSIAQKWGAAPDATTQLNNIRYDPTHLEPMTDNSIEDIMAHEMTHVRQNQAKPWYQKMYESVMGAPSPVAAPSGLPQGSTMSNPYYWQPNEMEAFQTMRNRQMGTLYPVDPVTGQTDRYLDPKKQKGINTAPTGY